MSLLQLFALTTSSAFAAVAYQSWNKTFLPTLSTVLLVLIGMVIYQSLWLTANLIGIYEAARERTEQLHESTQRIAVGCFLLLLGFQIFFLFRIVANIGVLSSG